MKNVNNIPTVANTLKEYGILIYDIPVDKEKVYYSVKRAMGHMAVPLNLSVYLIHWGLRDKIENLLRSKITIDCDIKFIKFDSSALPDLDKQVQSSLKNLISQIHKRIEDKLAEVKNQTDQKKYDFKYEIRTKIADIEGLSAIFPLDQDVELAFQAVRQLYQLEMTTGLMAV